MNEVGRMKYGEALKFLIKEDKSLSYHLEDVEASVNGDGVEIVGDEMEVFYSFLQSLRGLNDNQKVYGLFDILDSVEEGLSEEVAYWVLAQEIVEREIVLLGDEAVEKAREVEGLVIKDIDILGFESDPRDVISRLLEAYKQMQGEVAPFLIGQHIGDISTERIDVPEEIERYL